MTLSKDRGGRSKTKSSRHYPGLVNVKIVQESTPPTATGPLPEPRGNKYLILYLFTFQYNLITLTPPGTYRYINMPISQRLQFTD